MAGDALSPGMVLAGKYKIERVLGEGGMATVLLAEHLKLGHRVAIKVLRQELAADAALVERFEREGRALCRLKSSNVVRAFDVDVTPDGAPMLVMEYLEGCDAEQELSRRGVLPIGEVVEWTLQACRALAEAHAAGLVHRDIKPTNLFLTTEGGARVVKVLDFGIAGDLLGPAGDARLTRAETVMGTPLYMAPEQFRATRDVDARADVWALGATLYELLTGKPPFTGTEATVGVAVVTEEAPPIESLRKDVPPGLVAAVARALEKDRDKRFPTMKDFADALRPFGDEVTVLPRALSASLPEAREIGTAETMVGAIAAAPAPATVRALTASMPPRRSRAATWLAFGVAGVVAAGTLAAVVVARGGAREEAAPVESSRAPTGATSAVPSAAVSPSDVAATPVASLPAPATPPSVAVKPPSPPAARSADAAPATAPSAPATPAPTSSHPLFFPR